MEEINREERSPEEEIKSSYSPSRGSTRSSLRSESSRKSVSGKTAKFSHTEFFHVESYKEYNKAMTFNMEEEDFCCLLF